MRWTVAAVSARCASLRSGSRCVQPGEFGVREPRDLRVHRGDDGRRRRLAPPFHVRGRLGGDNGTDLGNLVRHRPVGQLPAECGQVDERDPVQLPNGGVDVGRHA